MFKRGRTLYAYFALLLGVICIGWSAIFVRFANVPGPVSAFYRFVVAGTVILPWEFFKRQNLPSRSDTILIIIGGIFFALDLTLWNTSLLLIPAAPATLLGNCAPLWVGLGVFILFREKLPISYWIGLTIALTGMAFLIGRETLGQLEFNMGYLLAIGGSVFYAAYIITVQRARSRVSTSMLMAISNVSGIVFLLVVNLALGTDLIGHSSMTWVWLVALGLVSQLGGWLAINYALGHLRAAPTSVGLLGQPIITALLAIPLLGESLNTNQIIGGVLVLGGVLLANVKLQQSK